MPKPLALEVSLRARAVAALSGCAMQGGAAPLFIVPDQC